MPEIFKKNIRRAAENVISFGDTDVFPFSFENILVRNQKEKFVDLIESISNDFSKNVDQSPPQFESSLAPAGYNGFRWITQIDPYWNCYLLSAMIRHAKEIENSRISLERNTVHSYRYDMDETGEELFLKAHNWRSFMVESFERAKSSEYVIITDISEFYGRVYHHRVENSLERVCNTNLPDNVIELLSRFSLGTSYGLPVGGPAARIIAEAVINQIDHLLTARGISFCRFVDDFHIFANSQQDAHKAIQQLSELLITNQGLSLQKSKTRIMSASEFISTFPKHLIPGQPPESDRERLFSLSLNFDPYSPTAHDDYEALKSSLEEIDFLSLLNEELGKSQIHVPTINKLIKALKVTKKNIRIQAIKTLMDSISLLYPVLSFLLIVIASMKKDLDDEELFAVSTKIIDLIENDSYLMALDVHKCFSIKIINDFKDYRVDTILTQWLMNGSPMLKRDTILGFIARGGWNHLSDFKNRVAGQTPWVRRAMIAASYGLGDEGKHWRQAQNFTDFDIFVRDSVSSMDLAKLAEMS